MPSFNKWLLMLGTLYGMLPVGAQTQIALTGQNIALVSEERTLTLEKGACDLVIKDLPQSLIPASVMIDVPGGDITEQNFVVPRPADAPLNQNLGKTVTVIQPGVYEQHGVLLEARNGMLVLRDSDGVVRMFRQNDNQIVRLEAYNGAAATQPNLQCRIHSEKSGGAVARLTYLTRGLSWQTDYNIWLDKDNQLTLSASVHIQNNSGKSYENARLVLLSGNLHLNSPAAPVRGLRKEVYSLSADASDNALTQPQGLFDYYQYPLQGSWQLNEGAIKQIPFLKPTVLRAEKHYRIESTAPQQAALVYTFKNSRANGLGRPLPPGSIRFYTHDNQMPLFLGEDRMKATPVNGTAEWQTGHAFDIIYERQEKVERPNRKTEVHNTVYRVKNLKKETVKLEIRESFPIRSEARVIHSDLKDIRIANGKISGWISLPAQSEQEISVNYQYKW